MKIEFNSVTWYSKLVALALFIALPFAGFYAGMKYQKAITADEVRIIKDKDNTSSPSSTQKTTINIKTNDLSFTSTYQNGLMKYQGTVTVPTPCYEVKQEALIAESFPEQVTIRIKTELVKEVIPQSCIQVVSQKPFSGEAKVDKNAIVRIFLNDKEIK